MKTILLFYSTFILSLIFGIGLRSDYPNQQKQIVSQVISINDLISETAITPIGVIQEMIGQVNKDRALSDLRRLTGEEQICLDHGCYTIANRLTGSVGLQLAKDYVCEELVNLGYSVEIQDWSASGYSDQNLIIRKTGINFPEEEIYFVSHLDGVNYSPAADDNASGVVGLLELARILRSRPISSTMVLLFSTGEEQGALGVRSYVNQLTLDQLEAINYVVNVDMISYDSNNDGVMELWNGTQPVDFVQVLIDIISAYQIGLMPQIVSDCS
jgi:hypothetical protein